VPPDAAALDRAITANLKKVGVTPIKSRGRRQHALPSQKDEAFETENAFCLEYEAAQDEKLKALVEERARQAQAEVRSVGYYIFAQSIVMALY
jgi:Ni,Fe-hydrogenase III component G